MIEKTLKPHFERQLVEDRRKDGYWIQTIQTNGNQLDIIGSGLGEGEINLYRAPNWKPRRIAKYEGPVAIHHGDINRNGRQDLIVCYQYGATMVMCDPQGGKIDWLQNPGTVDGEWKRHYIGRSTAMHRLRLGYFTQTQKLEVLGLPIVGRPNDPHSIAPVKLFTQPEDLLNASQWNQHTIDNTHFRVIHEVSVGKYNRLFGIQPESNLDSAILASEEGITWIYYSLTDKKWRFVAINGGQTSQASRTGFKGVGNVATGRFGDDQCAYIVTMEPFHGNTVAIYHKNRQTSSVTPGWKWRWERTVLDVYDNPNNQGEGPGHFVVCGDFDGDGQDEFLVALRGPQPWQGVIYYKILDLQKGIVAKWKVSSDSAARIALGDFGRDGRLSFATIGYSVGGYYQAENACIAIFRNDFAPVPNRFLTTLEQARVQSEIKEEKNTRDIPFGKNIHGTWIHRAPAYQIQSRTIAINLGNKTPIVQASPYKKILPKTSVILQKNTIITNVQSILLIQVDEKLDFKNIHKQSGWKLLSELDPSFDPSIKLYKSGQFDLGEIQFDPRYLCGDTQTEDISRRRRYNLKVNLWYCPPSTNCGIHIRHVQPHDFLEVHTQIYGNGRMQKFHENKFQTFYYDRLLSPGQTHEPFASLIDGQFIYPWHQYYSDTDCIWIANQFHVL